MKLFFAIGFNFSKYDSKILTEFPYRSAMASFIKTEKLFSEFPQQMILHKINKNDKKFKLNMKNHSIFQERPRDIRKRDPSRTNKYH